MNFSKSILLDMKKLMSIFVILTILLNACVNSDLKRLEAKSKDLHCKTESAQRIMKYDNILLLSVKLKLQKDYEKAFASFSDTTLSCEQANEKWDSFVHKLDSISSKGIK